MPTNPTDPTDQPAYFLDELDKAMASALNPKHRKVSQMERELVDCQVMLAQLRQLIAPETVKYFDPFSEVTNAQC